MLLYRINVHGSAHIMSWFPNTLLDRHDSSSGQFGVVLLDMMLPHESGMEVLRHLAARGADIPVVAMSASNRHLATALTSGVQAILAKPFELERLRALVERYCPREPG